MKKHSYLKNKLQSILFTIALVLCYSFNAQAGIDLELTLTAPNASPGIFENVTVTATISNTGNEPATNVLLEFPTFPSDLPVTGDPVESQGFFSNWWTGTGTWEVGTLAPGASATVEIGLFPLAENIDFYGEVASADQSDADSTPGNGTPNMPNEDDESVLVINDTGANNCVLNAQISNIICDDNGTPDNEADDFFRFDMLVTGQNTSGIWAAVIPIPGGGISEFMGTVGETVTLGHLISEVNLLYGGTLEFFVTTFGGPVCSTSVAVATPPSCSNGGGLCSISGTFFNPQCSDAGTPTNPNDDVWSFVLNATSTNSNSDSYLAHLNGLTFTADYDEDVPFGLFPIADGDITVVLTDQFDPSCTETLVIPAPSTCSNGSSQCEISLVNLETTCFDNGTTDPFDDQFRFDMEITGTNNSMFYTATIPGPTTLSGGNEIVNSYNLMQSIALYNIDEANAFFNGEPISFTVTDSQDSNCTTQITFDIPPTCSGPGGNDIDLELSMSSPTQNPTIFDNGTVVVSVTNTSQVLATNIEIEVPSPVGYVYQGGNEFVASQGNFNFNGTQVWFVGNLSPNETATLEVNYFFLANPDGIANYAQVIGAGQNDSDSTPDNGTCCTPNEDDEAVFTFGGVINTPDLTVSDFAENWPTPLAIGTEYPFTFNLKNIGAGTAVGDYHIGVYLSTDGFLDGNDYLIGEVDTGDTPVGTISGVPGLVEVPSNVPSDSYFVLLVADDLNDISETNENNNIQVSNDTYEVDNGGNNCSGLFVATTQAELDQFDQSCTTWAGAIELSGNITDLSPLGNLDHILGNLTLDGTLVISLFGLGNLQSAGALFLYNNGELNSTTGLSPNFETTSIQIINSFNLNGISNLPITNSLTDLTIANNANLLTFSGFSGLSGNYPNLELTVAQLPNVTLLQGFESFTQLKRLSLSGFESLLSLDGLENLTAVENLTISGNPILTNCCAIFDLLNNGGVSGTTAISNNDMGCNSVQDVLDNCELSSCQISATVLDIQCQSNLTLNNGGDDTYTARILVEGTNDCFGNYKIDGELGGIFGSPAIFGRLATVGPFPISGGDVTITITDSNDQGAVQVTLNAPSTCSNGVDPNECGFENTYTSLPGTFLNIGVQKVTESAIDYKISNFGNTVGNSSFVYYDLNIDFAGTEVNSSVNTPPSGAILRADNGNYFRPTNVPTNQLEIVEVTPTDVTVWTNTFDFDSGGLQSDPVLRDVITLSDGYAFLVAANGPQDIIWILKTDFDGNVIYNNQLTLTSGLLSLNFDQLASNGDFLIYRQSSARVGHLIRASANGNFLFEEPIIGDLVSNRFGGFDESPDGNFVFASYLEFPFPILEKVDAFTGERQWKIRLTDVFSPNNDLTFGTQADLVATADGGAVVGYNTSSPVGVPSAYEYGKVNAAGNLVWWRNLPESYSLNAKLATSDNGVLFVGSINDVYAVVKTTSEGLLTPTCVGGGGGTCNISATVNISDCDNNGTPNDPSDDTFSYDITVVNPGGGSGFIIPGICNLIDNGDYGTTYTNGPFNIQSYSTGGSFCILADENDTDCTTNIQVIPPATCSNGGGGNDPDLELNISSNSTFMQYDFASFDLTLTNAGNVAATGITVEIFGPDGGVWQGGNEGDADIGVFYPSGSGISTWELTNLAAGETATLTVNVFVLGENGVTVSAEVDAQSPADADSTPNNYHPDNGAPVEDDEDQFTLSGSSPLVAQNGGNIVNSSIFATKLFPNPTRNLLNVEIFSETDRSAIVQIANVSGKIIQQQDFYLEKGKNGFQLEVNELVRGVYFLKIETAEGVVLQRFVKQ